ncbi:MAG: DUF6695 family protein [Bacteroidota bacterium]
MYSNPHHKANACAIAIAYPDFYIVPEQRWYMSVFKAMGMVRKGMISAGHAGIILINKENGEIKYADFGRYCTPNGKGRVRMLDTDPELKINLNAAFNKKGRLLNLEEILYFFEKRNDITEGVGPMFASLNENLNYAKADNYIKSLATKGSIPYNLTKTDSSNCARFVADTICKATYDERSIYKFKNHYKPFVSPLGNVYCNAAGRPIYKVENGTIEAYDKNGILAILNFLWFNSPNESNMPYKNLEGKYAEPDRSGIPAKAQWLGGYADGAWFEIKDQCSASLLINKYNSNKSKVFQKTFLDTTKQFNSNASYQFTYDSNAMQCSVIQNGNPFHFKFIE